MNFKNISVLFLTLFFLTTSCGLKRKPLAPKNSFLPSIVDQNIIKKTKKNEEENEKETKTKKKI